MQSFIEQVKQTLETPTTTGFLGDVERNLQGIEDAPKPTPETIPEPPIETTLPEIGFDIEDFKRQVEELKADNKTIQHIHYAIDRDSEIINKAEAKTIADQ